MLVPLLGVASVACTGAIPHVMDQWKHPGVFLRGRVRGGGAAPQGELELLPLPSKHHQSRIHTELKLAPCGGELKRIKHRVCVCVLVPK